MKIISPTTINTGDVAAEVTMPARGAKKIAKVKQMAVVRAVRPVFPPAAIPAVDSAYDVTVDAENANQAVKCIKNLYERPLWEFIR